MIKDNMIAFWVIWCGYIYIVTNVCHERLMFLKHCMYIYIPLYKSMKQNYLPRENILFLTDIIMNSLSVAYFMLDTVKLEVGSL